MSDDRKNAGCQKQSSHLPGDFFFAFLLSGQNKYAILKIQIIVARKDRDFMNKTLKLILEIIAIVAAVAALVVGIIKLVEYIRQVIEDRTAVDMDDLVEENVIPFFTEDYVEVGTSTVEESPIEDVAD